MLFVYLDESGCLGFDFKNKKPSEYFTITVVVAKWLFSHRAIKKEVETVIKRKINTKAKNSRVVDEIKWSRTSLQIRKYLFKRVSNIDFSIYSISFNKRNVNLDLRRNPARLYNYFVKQLIDKIDLSIAEDKITIVLDKSKNKEQIKDCNTYLINHIESRIPLEIDIDVIHENSVVIKQLQLADVFCYGFYEKYNKNCLDWYNVFQSKITYDELWYK